MSQIIKTLTSSGPFPPNIPTTFQAQNSGVNDGTATPAANTINFNATYVVTNNLSGFAVAASGSTVTYELTNRYQTSQSFSDSSTHTIYTQTLGAAGTYFFVFDLVAYNVTSGLSACYRVKVPLNSNGVGSTSFPAQEFYEAEQGAMTGVVVSAGAQSGNQFFVSVKGYNTDTINWNLTGYYIQVN